MRKILVALVAAALVAAPLGAAVTPKQASALLRIAAKLSTLQPRGQVRIVVQKPAGFKAQRVRLLDRIYPPQAQSYDEALYRSLGLITGGGKGVLRRALIEEQKHTGVYDPLTHTAFVQAGKSERTALLHELVHALQDQHYDLRRIGLLNGNRDAGVAALAAVEGHAALVVDVVGERSASPHRGTLLEQFLALERGFAYSVGLRFSSELRNLGGTPGVLASLRRFPETSEQIFHLDKFLERERALPIVLPVEAAGLTLAADNSFGELDVRALLAVFHVPRLDHAGSGWGGGRSALYRGPGGEATAIVLRWDTERDAAEWEEAVASYVNEAFDPDTPGPPPRTPCASAACWELAGRSIAFRRDGARTALAISANVPAADALAQALVPAG